MSAQKYQAYNAAKQTIAKTKQIVLIYDGIIRLLQQAKEAIQNKRIEDRFKLLTRASDIVVGLQCCLDFEKGGDVARTLQQFYADMQLRIFSIHRSNSLSDCDEVIAELKQMRDAWDEIDRNTASGDVTAASESASSATDTDQTVTLSA